MARTGLYVLILAVLMWSLGGAGLAGTLHAAETVRTNAESAALIDVASGRILYSQSGDKRMRIASLTKILTAIVAIENGKLEDKVTVSSRAFGKEGSSIYLKTGEEISLHHLLYGLMLRSGNDAATAIAEHVGGTLDGFVFLMNRKAEELGLRGSQFRNPHGLDEEGHYSTANDMAVLTAYALKNPVFQEIVKTKTKKVPRQDQPWDSVWNNKNKMLRLYPGADGVKTGFTKLARRCLVSSATRDGQQLAAVTLNDGSDWEDHMRLMDYGFREFPLHTVVDAGESVKEGLEAAKSFRYPANEDERSLFRREIRLENVRSSDYRLGERGSLQIYMDGRRVGSVPLRDSIGEPKASVPGRSGKAGSQTTGAGAEPEEPGDAGARHDDMEMPADWVGEVHNRRIADSGQRSEDVEGGFAVQFMANLKETLRSLFAPLSGD